MSLDRGYVNLIAHLNASSSSLPSHTLNASVAHYLARAQPSATPLAAIVVSSPRFKEPLSSPVLDGLQNAFRHAVHLKIKCLNDEHNGVFSRGLPTRIAEWVSQVLKGLQGGHPVLRLACCAGLLHGVNDHDTELRMQQSAARRRLEEELVIALAEIIDIVTPTVDPWEAEFRSYTPTVQDSLPSTLVLCSGVLPLVAPLRLKALPLETFSRIIQASIVDTFQHGDFAASPSSHFEMSNKSRLHIPKGSTFAQNIESISTSLLHLQMASLSAMYTQVVAVMAEHRPSKVWSVVADLVHTLEGMAKTVEDSWGNNALADVEDEELLTSDAQVVATSVWMILKTLLFTTIRLIDRVLHVILFVSPPLLHPHTVSTPQHSAFDLTRLCLRTISHLSFILPRFGGVSSTASAALPELLKTFYTALDVLSSDAMESRKLVKEVCADVARMRVETGVKRRIRQAKEAYALACVEQLVPVLDDQTMKEDVYALCEPHLDDPTHRETYESAHSVMLAIFSAHAKAQKAGTVSSEGAAFAEQIVPAYAHRLIVNSAPHKLNTTQLCMAYRALVGCASVFGDSSTPTSSSASEAAAKASVPGGDAYAWFCIDLLLSAIRTTAGGSAVIKEHRKKLLLALVSTVSAVSLGILPRLLGEIDKLLMDVLEPSSELAQDERMEAEEGQEELVKTLFDEVLNVGDEEKEFAIRWWSEWKARLRDKSTDSEPVAGAKGKGKEVLARL